MSADTDQAVALSRPSPGMSALDQLLADPIVQLLMHRDQTDESAIRHLLQEVARARSASRKDSPSLAGAPFAIALLLLETVRLWRRRNEREADRIPRMTGAGWAVLCHLTRRQGVSQTALARTLEIGPARLVRLVDQLETAGLVARMPDPHDRRVNVLVVTAKARPIIALFNDLARKALDDALIGFSGAEIDQVQSYLSRMRRNLVRHLGDRTSSDRQKPGDA